MEWFLEPQIWIGLLSLTFLEIVLGIDNIVFISVLAARLPEEQQDSARKVGLLLAMGTRILLLLGLSWLVGLTAPLFSVFSHEVSGRDLILGLGGVFLIWKSTREIHHHVEGIGEQKGSGRVASYGSVLVQIMLLDVVFSLDSVITAVGMVDSIAIMIAAIVISILVMMLAAGSIAMFVERYPTVKMLALSFLFLVGMALVADGMGFHIPRGYLYFAMGFSLTVELLNLWRKKKLEPTRAQKN